MNLSVCCFWVKGALEFISRIWFKGFKIPLDRLLSEAGLSCPCGVQFLTCRV